MQRSVGEITKMTGVSARTLHYYDEIGLLKPQQITPAGYRYYGQEELDRLQQILFYRELDFSLTEIARILSAPDYDRIAAMRQNRTLLVMRRDRLNALIRLTDETLKGEKENDMNAFNKTEIERTRAQYEDEARSKWGDTQAYQESERRMQRYSEQEKSSIQAEMDDLVREFSNNLDCDPAGEQVQQLVKRWQEYITKRYYPCTNEILAGLGEMYVADERFAKNLDRFADGTAQLMAEGIRAFVQKQ